MSYLNHKVNTNLRTSPLTTLGKPAPYKLARGKVLINSNIPEAFTLQNLHLIIYTIDN